MGNIRKLKKEIDSKFYELMSDCFTWQEVHTADEQEEVNGILSDAVNFRNDLMQRVNHPSADSEPKGIKTHYQLIRRELESGSEKLFGRLSSVSKKKKR